MNKYLHDIELCDLDITINEWKPQFIVILRADCWWYCHKPFIQKYNKIGTIKPQKIINELKKCGIDETTLYFEFSFREREPFDSSAIKDIKESVKYWRRYLD